jgi:hypothetical protein
MPVLMMLAAENEPSQYDSFTPSDMTNSRNSLPAHGRIQYRNDDLWSRNDWGMPLTNFAAPWPAHERLSPDSHETTRLSLHHLSQTHSAKIRGHGRVSGFQGMHDERSHASSEETLLYPEDLPKSAPQMECQESASTVAGDAELEKIYEEYLAKGGETKAGDAGVTIMLRDIPYKMQVEPHIFDLLQSTSDLNHVDYVYLPMTIALKRSPDNHSDATRNKGYCFIHFSNNASAQLFVSRLEHYVLPASLSTTPSKLMNAGLAKFQGLSLNLLNLLDIHSKKWRPKNGNVYIRRAGGELAPYGLLRLRNLLKRRVAARTENRRR